MKTLRYHIALLLCFHCPKLFAGTKTWDGQGIFENWDSGVNWVGNNAPVSNDDLVWPANGAVGYITDNNYSVGTQFRTLRFTSVDAGPNHGWDHRGNRVHVTSGIHFDGITRLRLPIRLTGDQSWVEHDSSGNVLDFEAPGGLDVNGRTLSTTGSIRFTSGTLSGSGLIQVQSATGLSVKAASSYTGRINLLADSDLDLGGSGSFTDSSCEVHLGSGARVVVENFTGATASSAAQIYFDAAVNTTAPEFLNIGGIFTQKGAMEFSGREPLIHCGDHGIVLKGELRGSGYCQVNASDSFLRMEGEANSSTATGRLNVKGDLQLARSLGRLAWSGLVLVEDGTVTWEVNSQLGGVASLELKNAVGLMNSRIDSVARLTMSNSTLSTGSGNGTMGTREGVFVTKPSFVGGGSIMNGSLSFNTYPALLDITQPAGSVGTTFILTGDIGSSGAVGSRRVVKTGNGAMDWTGDGALDTLEVEAGTMKVLGSSPATDMVLNGGTLELAGSCRHLSAAALGGNLKLRNVGDITAINVSLNSFTTFFVQAGDAAFPKLVATGTVALNGAALESATSNPIAVPVNSVRVIINKTSAGAVSGTFTHQGISLPEGSTVVMDTFTWKISYVAGDGNDVALTLLSVPATGLTRTYTPPNGGTNQWANAAVWTPASNIVPGDALSFGTAANFSPANNLPADTSIHGLRFSVLGHRVAGARIALSGSIQTTHGSGTSIVTNPILLANSIISFHSSSSALLRVGENGIGGGVELNGKILAIQPEHATSTVEMGGSPEMITGTGLVRKTGLGVAVLKNHSTYTGLTIVEAGTLRIENEGASLGAGGAGNETQVLSGATLELANLGGSGVPDDVQLYGKVRVDAGTGSASIGGTLTIGVAEAELEVASGTLALGPIAGNALHKTGPGTLYLSSSNLSFTGPLKCDAGTVRMLGINTNWPGNVTMLAGTLSLERANALTGEVLMGPGALLDLSDGPQLLTRLDLNNAAVQTATHEVSAPFMQVFGNGTTTWSGLYHVRTNSLVRVYDTPAAAEDFTVNAPVTAAAGAVLTIDGTGKVKFTGANTITQMILSGATSQYTGSSPSMAISLNGGTLGGSGTVGTVTSTAAGGRVEPGTSTGILRTSDVAWNAATTFAPELNGSTPGTGHDQLKVTGTVNLGGAALQLIPLAGATGIMVIVDNDGADAISGTFAGLPESTIVAALGKSFRISYIGGTGNDVTLTTLVQGTGITRTWTGQGGNSFWTNTANWLGGNIPLSGDDILFPATAGSQLSQCNYATGTTFNSIRITASGYLISGNAIALNAGVIFDFPTGTSTVSLDVTMAQTQTISVLQGAQAVLTPATSLVTAGFSLSVQVDSVAGRLTLANVSGTGNLIKTGPGALTLNANTFTGTTTLNGGESKTNVLTAFGNGASSVVVNSDAELRFENIASSTFTRGITLAGKLELSASPITLSGAISLPAGGIRVVEVEGATPALSGIISGSGSLEKRGTGTLSLSGAAANTFTGGCTVAEGTLRLAKATNINALQGPVTIGDGTGMDMLLYAAAGQIGNTATVSLLGSGAQMQCSTFSDAIGALHLSGGSVTGSGTVTVADTIRSFASASTGNVDVNISPTASPFPVIVENGAAATDLLISGEWTGASSQIVERSGSGKLQFGGNGTAQTLRLKDGLTLITKDWGGVNISLENGQLGGSGPIGAITTLSGARGEILPGASTDILMATSWIGTSDTTLTMEIGGLTPGTQHDVLNLRGVADPQDAKLDLVLVPGFTVMPGQTFTIVTNDDRDAVPSEFYKLEEGTIFTFAGANTKISYQGGDGNDVTLTILSIVGTGNIATWDGGGGTMQWSHAANWADDLAPVTGDSLVFPLTPVGPQLVTVNDLPIGTSFQRISLTGSNNVITGNAVFLNAGIVTNSPGANQVVMGFTMTGPQSIEQSGSGSLTFTTAGTVNLAGNALTLATPGIGSIVMEGAISGSGSLLRTSFTQAAGVLLSGPNTWTGSFSVSSGTLRVVQPGSLGTSGSVLANARLVLESAVPVTFTQTVSLSGQMIAQNALQQFNGILNLPTAAVGTVTAEGAGTLTLAGRIQGTGRLHVSGNSTVKLAGTVANTFTGGCTVENGDLILQKTAGITALPGPITIGPAGSIISPPRLIHAAANQIADTASTTLHPDSSVNLTGFNDTIANLTMTSGRVLTGDGTLTLTGNVTTNASATVATLLGNIAHTGTGVHDWTIADGAASPDVQGDVVITFPAAATVRKQGLGSLKLTRDLFGALQIAAGTVDMEGSSSSTLVTMTGGTLTGIGGVGTIASSGGGFIRPGGSPESLASQSLTWDSNLTFVVELLNSTEISGHDQLTVNGTVNLGGATLDLSLLPGFTSAISETFRIIRNDTTADPVTGNFDRLTEGTHFFKDGLLFRISYIGGDGNDVVLTRVEETPPVITSASIVPGTGPNAGQFVGTFDGLGLPGIDYRIEKSPDLTTWSPLSTSTAAPNGSFSFITLEPQTSTRTFYRISGP